VGSVMFIRDSDDSARRRVGDPGRLGGFEGPGVEVVRGDGTQEGVGRDRVLVGGGKEEEQPGVVGQGADLLAVRPQQFGGERGGFRRERVEARRLPFGEERYEFGGGARIAVRGAEDAHADTFGKRGAELLPRVRELRWRNARLRRGIHRGHHTTHVTGELQGA
jgi:hypothetical protein